MKLKDYKCRECGSENFVYNEKENKIICAYCGKYLKFANKDDRNLMNHIKEKFKYLDTDSVTNASEDYYTFSKPSRCRLSYTEAKEFLNKLYGLSTSREFSRPLVFIKYHAPIEKIVANEKGDWIDLRAAETFKLKKGEFRIISLGISVQLPEGYEAHIVPRSSTFKKWHIIQTNGVGIIDNSYNGDNDIWGMPVLATEDTVIHIDDRICQFRIVKKQPEIIFHEVDHLGNTDRGGFGSTGTN